MMMINGCPNDDPNFTKILAKLFYNDDVSKITPQIRQDIFSCICVPLRIFLFFMIYLLRNQYWIYYITAIFSFMAIILLLQQKMNKNNQEKQWWSKSFQLIMAILVFFFSLNMIINFKNLNNSYRYIVPLLLFISLLGGVFQSLFIDFC